MGEMPIAGGRKKKEKHKKLWGGGENFDLPNL